MSVRRLGRPLSPHEFKLIFLPWQLRQQYRADPATVLITKELADYFDDLEANHGIKLDAEQRAWYAVTQKKIGPDSMLKEYPSYPEEAFKVSIEGAYFKTQMTKAREERRIGKVPVDPSRPVNTFWDIGKSDNTAIWFHQNKGQMHHLVDFTKTTARASSITPASCARKPPKEAGPTTNITGPTTSTTVTGYCQAASGFRTWPGTSAFISSWCRAFTTSRIQ
jgi:hypothetical protein